jgi:hypothetical protein
MSTAYDVQYPKDMVRAVQHPADNWAESTIHTVVDCIEHQARTRPLSFAIWTFGIGFLLGWKLKPW